jgi:diacylglycerol kinase
MKSFFHSRKISFGHAWEGLVYMIRTQPNAQIELVFTILVLALSILFNLSMVEWLFILSAIFVVIITEVLNTAIEKSMDKITREFDKEVKIIKDISAAAVLLSVVYALVIGGLILIPKTLAWLESVFSFR